MALHTRLAVGTAALLLTLAVVLGIWIANIAQRYHAEVEQRLNAGVAMYVTRELTLLDAGGVNQAAMQELARRVMTVHPSAEVYLLDTQGNVVATLISATRLKQRRVSLGPILEFIEHAPNRLVYGEDPTQPGQPVSFSAAPVRSATSHLGYLYVVLGGERFDSAVAAIRGSYSLQLGLIVTVSILIVTLTIGIGVFAVLTLPLRKLRRRMAEWSDQIEGATPQSGTLRGGADDIAALEQQFERMASRIGRQLAEIRSRDIERRNLIAAISHDLRTPLASLHGYLETVLLKDDTLSAATRRQYLETARHHSERLERLIGALFELSKLEAGMIVPKMEQFSLAELLHDIVLRFRLRAQQLGIELATAADPQAPFVMGDIALVERAFENLLDNALRHTPAGGRVQLRMRVMAHFVQVAVSDTGRGVPTADLPHVFESYYRGTERGRGSGLGLAIVRRIVELHGQRVTMSSAPEQGTTVEFGLPFAAPSKVAAAPANAAA